MARDHRVEVAGTQVFARTFPGDGPPIVLVHGLAISGAYFWPLAAELAPEWTVHVVDLPGTGRSGDDDGPPDVPRLAGWLEGWMDAVGLDAAVFVANSFGCQIVAELGIRAPRRVRAAVWLGPAIDASRGILDQALRLAWSALREPLSLIGLFLRDVWRYGPIRAARTFLLAVKQPFLERLATLQAPLLIVRGERDLLASERYARRLARSAPHGAYLTVPGAHAVHYERPAELAATLRPFLRQAAARDGQTPGRTS